MWRVAIYAREAPGRVGRRRLDRQVAGLAAKVARQPGLGHVASYGDLSLSGYRPGLARLLADAPDRFDVVVVDGYCRISPNRRQLASILDQLRWAGVGVVVLEPSAGHRFAKLVANLALADLIGEAAR
ncbi:MAG: recombinase family protein [Actinomycetota bacterium]|jgi:DNA invertase Pin-like site-specific DNA recombinase|nr:recombinase family protein [Actinomycetota bacterium]